LQIETYQHFEKGILFVIAKMPAQNTEPSRNVKPTVAVFPGPFVLESAGPYASKKRLSEITKRSRRITGAKP
jgi:hypothetical protein